jgi:hypothetical protein
LLVHFGNRPVSSPARLEGADPPAALVNRKVDEDEHACIDVIGTEKMGGFSLVALQT